VRSAIVLIEKPMAKVCYHVLHLHQQLIVESSLFESSNGNDHDLEVLRLLPLLFKESWVKVEYSCVVICFDHSYNGFLMFDGTFKRLASIAMAEA
jgi:hypothetical protein